MSSTPAREPRSPDEELLTAELPTVREELDDGQRTARATEELETGFRTLADLGRAVSIFGSARVPQDAPEYQAREIAHRLGQEGCAIITGGGPGLMEAANRGAQDAGVTSVGLNIVLPFEQAPNPYQDLSLLFDFFFTRKVMFARYSSAFVVLPGGYGTLDELFEALVLIQTQKIGDFPVVLVGSAFWGGLVDWMRERLLGEDMVSAGDLDLLTVTDDVDEIVAAVLRGCEEQWAAAA